MKRRLFTVGVVLALVGALMLATGPKGGATGTTTLTAGTTATFKGTASTVSRASSGQLSTLTAAGGATSRVGQRKLTTPQLGHRTRSTTMARPVAHAADSGTVTAATSAVSANFKGLNSLDQLNAYGGTGSGSPSPGFVLEPPDQGLCAGTYKGSPAVFEPVNTVIDHYSPAGVPQAAPLDLNTFFGESQSLNVSDPRCLFDKASDTFFFTSVIYTNDLFTDNHTDVAVLKGSTGAMSVYKIDTRFSSDTAGGCPCFGDQPKLGIDKNNVYVVVDQFNSPNGIDETGDALIALSKSQLVARAATVNRATFNNLSLGGIGVTALQPAITPGSSNVEFLLNSFPYADAAQTQPNTSEDLLGLWALTNTANVTSGGVPKLAARIISSEHYGAPVQAQATNGLSLASFSNDSRMQQVETMNGKLWGALDSAMTVGTDPTTRDGAAWFELAPSVNTLGVPSASFTNQGYVGSAGRYLVYPAIVATSGGAVAIGFGDTSATLHPSTGYVLRNSTDTAFGAIHLTATGPTADIGFTCAPPFEGSFQQCRWGDYSWATIDPDGTHLWMADETTSNNVAIQVLPPIPGLPPFISTNWGTEIWELTTS